MILVCFYCAKVTLHQCTVRYLKHFSFDESISYCSLLHVGEITVSIVHTCILSYLLQVCWSVYKCVGQSTSVLVSLQVCWSVYKCVGQSTSVLVSIQVCWSVYKWVDQSTSVLVSLQVCWSVYKFVGQSTSVLVSLQVCWSV